MFTSAHPVYRDARAVKAAAAFAVLIASALPASAQNLLTNGSFEGVANGSPSLPNGSTDIPGWTVIQAEIAWIQSGDFTVIASDGSRCLDLTGYHDSAPYGGVTQTLQTSIGAIYRLSIDLGSIVSGNNVSLDASAGSTTQNFFFARTGNGSEQQYGTFGFDFVATSSSTNISFIGASSVSGNNIGIDNASVTLIRAASAPEPGTLALLLPGLTLGAAGITRRRLLRHTTRA